MNQPLENPVLRMRRGHAAAAERQRELLSAEGPRPAQAVREAVAVLEALAAEGKWPAQRDSASEAAVVVVRERWARIEHNARKASAR